VTSFSPTVGSPLPNTKIKIIDENFNQVAVSEVGQVCVYGPQVMQGYWKNEEKTKFTIDEEGWLRTGDLGYLDHNGELTIVDRMKDLIIVSGFNVFPSEIEDTVNQREDILEAAAVSHVEDGIESIKLFLVPKNIQNPPNKQEIIDYLSEFLAPYKVPKNIHFINELPKSPVGKILKREL
jgi:long-chain acyl-CoA synthetase